MSTFTTMTSTPASEALDAFLVGAPTTSNKRVKRSSMDSPASDSSTVFSFDMSELFASTTATEAFPSIAWSFDDDESDDASTCTNNSSLGKRKTTACLSRAKTNTHTNLNLLG